MNYTEKLDQLLSSYQMHYQNLRSLHWNIKGNAFFELHLKYEELYTRTQVIIDDLAERILSIGETPSSQFSVYMKNSLISENPIITDGKNGVSYVLEAQRTLLGLEREILNLSGEADDEGTNALMSDLIREKEKTNWMFRAYLG
ncbi:MAG: DNA starvation/stationary phase protection protein [Bacteroidetes bacterium]|nr:MAG: DNA starvation/stationary phase protection protein [Bacteroidota bacterium]